MAADLGKRLLAEVEEVGLDEILQAIRFQHEPEPARFGLPALDKILKAAIIDKSNPPAVPPILEITSQAPGSGVTHIIYLLIATTILSTSLGGHEACVAIIDTDNTFSVARLAQQLRLAAPSLSSSSILTALTHVHIFRPQSQTSLLATLESLPTYFLTTSHPSLHRPLAFIALDSLTAFHWQSKAAEEDRVFEKQYQDISEKDPSASKNNNQPDLSTLLCQTATQLSAPLVLISHSITNNATRSAIPATVRLTAHRQPVRTFPPGNSIVEAFREAGDRQRAVDASKWEVRVAAESSNHALRGMGFEFKITSDALELEKVG